MLCVTFFFFFKQKTAYELRISDWSSDVCSSDLQSGVYVVPQIGAGVWIEFEHGDLDYPVWVGGFWGSAAEVPALALAGNPASPSVVLQSGVQNTISISDVPGPTGGILLKRISGAVIRVTADRKSVV